MLSGDRVAYEPRPDFNLATQRGTDQTELFQQIIDDMHPFQRLVIPPAPPGFGYAVSNLVVSKPLSIVGTNKRGSRFVSYPGSSGYMLSVERGSTLFHENHGYGVHISDLTFDGNHRSTDVGGLRFDLMDHLTVERVDIRHTARQAMWLYRSVRESEFRSVLMRWCGSSGYATLDLSDQHTGDQHNNLLFDGIKVQYPFGDGVLIAPVASSSAVRNITFSGSMFHGLVPGQTIVSDYGDDYTVDDYTTTLVRLDGGRGVRFMGCRIHSSGYDKPLIHLASGVNEVLLGGCVLGTSSSNDRQVDVDSGRISVQGSVFENAASVAHIVNRTGDAASVKIDAATFTRSTATAAA